MSSLLPAVSVVLVSVIRARVGEEGVRMCDSVLVAASAANGEHRFCLQPVSLCHRHPELCLDSEGFGPRP